MKTKKLWAIAVAAVVVLGVIYYCVSYFTAQRSLQDMSPTQVVQYYFDKQNKKDKIAMNCSVTKENRNIDYEFYKFNYVKLLSSEEKTEFSRDEVYLPAQYNTYQLAKVEVEFEINYKGGGSSGFTNGTYKWTYYLVRENESSAWKIASWGV